MGYRRATRGATTTKSLSSGRRTRVPSPPQGVALPNRALSRHHVCMTNHHRERGPESVELSESRDGAQVIEISGHVDPDPPSASLFPPADPANTSTETGDN